MKKPHTFKLINGTFTANDVRKILMEMIQSKINFHMREIHSMEERGGGTTSRSEKRIVQLKKTAETLKKVLAKAEEKEINLKISATVQIEFLN
ncbi:MAG: hypothetical protein KF856_12850 [Cyclobacteriaceae bacterium]|nr:hypothetical protein [Cyclobacteriaceae bacterium]